MKKKIIIILLLIFTLFTIPACNTAGIIDGLNNTKVIVEGKSAIKIGEEFKAKAKITPEGKYTNSFSFSSSNESIIQVSEDGIVIGLQKGTASVVATLIENEKYSGKLYVKVTEEEIEFTDKVPESITFSGDTTCYVGTKAYYRFETTPRNACQDMIFKSSNEEIATIDRLGVATFLNEGTVIFTCYSEKSEIIWDSITVTVLRTVRDDDFETQTKKVIKETKDSILGVANYTYGTSHKPIRQSIGSGFVYRALGILNDGTYTEDLTNKNIKSYMHYLITNKHVVEGSDLVKIYIHMIDEEVPATLIHYDNKVDMAVIKFEYSSLIKPLLFGDSSIVEQGDTVIAIGNPEGFEYSSSATRGIVSHPERYISDDTDDDGVKDWDAIYIQHDASINPGNSGGPLLNMNGHVIGINTLKFASDSIDNMGFSIPSNTILELLPFLEKEKTPVRARIGTTLISMIDLLNADLSKSDYNYKIPEGITYGLYITGIEQGSVCDGVLQKDDILLEFNGLKLRKSIQLRAELGAIIVGSNTIIPIKVYRDGKEINLELKF